IRKGIESKSDPTSPAAARSVPAPSGMMIPFNRCNSPRSFRMRTVWNTEDVAADAFEQLSKRERKPGVDGIEVVRRAGRTHGARQRDLAIGHELLVVLETQIRVVG